tara:strand:- start:19 stop:804 length:786 start_codon:yes stop_codon:yes gene_type:complete
MKNSHYGTVYLVGAGPGDPDLLTVKARKLLLECSALVYDSLIPQEFLELVPSECQCHFVGKRKGHHFALQTNINQLLVDLAKEFPSVVRLKGGDPFLFGRGAEEAEYVVSHGISVEVVPGITSGMAVPAYLGIPLTHRLSGSSITFVAGHERTDKKRPLVNWRGLALSTDGLVIYMGVYNLQYITDELLAGGMDPQTPAVVIQQGTVIGQRFVQSSLSQLYDTVKTNKLTSPSIVLIGSCIDYQVLQCAPKLAEVTMPISF